jgi:hypothetical protein
LRACGRGQSGLCSIEYDATSIGPWNYDWMDQTLMITATRRCNAQALRRQAIQRMKWWMLLSPAMPTMIK